MIIDKFGWPNTLYSVLMDRKDRPEFSINNSESAPSRRKAQSMDSISEPSASYPNNDSSSSASKSLCSSSSSSSEHVSLAQELKVSYWYKYMWTPPDGHEGDLVFISGRLISASGRLFDGIFNRLFQSFFSVKLESNFKKYNELQYMLF